jgi:hypothetical protein
VLTDGLPAVETVCPEALAQGVHSANVILNVLVSPPATILTSAAPTLHRAPVAYCPLRQPSGDPLDGKAAFDEIMATAIERQHEPQRTSAICLAGHIGFEL